jgi:acetyltransferase-like isoleucine patch superfamily enzyme
MASFSDGTGPAASQQAPDRQAFASSLGRAAGVLRRVPSLLWTLEARMRGAELRGRVTFLGRPILTLAPGSRLVLAGENQVASSPRCNPLGNAQPCVLRTLAAGAVLEIGRGCGLSGAVVCAAREVSIGEGTILGSGAMVIDNDFHEQAGEFGWGEISAGNARPVRIGRGCFIGTRAIVLKGVTIGDRAVVGAGTVVTKDVPAGAVVVGNPARVVGA